MTFLHSITLMISAGPDCPNFILGDGLGIREVKVGEQTGEACVQKCLSESYFEDAINGVTIYSDDKPGE